MHLYIYLYKIIKNQLLLTSQKPKNGSTDFDDFFVRFDSKLNLIGGGCLGHQFKSMKI